MRFNVLSALKVKDSNLLSKVGAFLSTTKTSALGLLFAILATGIGFSSCSSDPDNVLDAQEPAVTGNSDRMTRASGYWNFSKLTYRQFTFNPKNIKMFSIAIDLSKYESGARYSVGVDYSGGGGMMLTESAAIPPNGIVKAYTTEPVKRINLTIQADSPIDGSVAVTY